MATIQDGRNVEDLLNLPIPKHGVQIKLTDQDGEVWVFVLRPMTRQAYQLIKSSIRANKGIDAAIGVVNMLKLPECPDANGIADVMALATLENALAEWMEPCEVEIKKN